MRLSRGAARQAPQPDDGALESWITDLTEGETSVRRFRERLAAAGTEPAGTCTACERAADESSRHESEHEHAPERLTA